MLVISNNSTCFRFILLITVPEEVHVVELLHIVNVKKEETKLEIVEPDDS